MNDVYPYLIVAFGLAVAMRFEYRTRQEGAALKRFLKELEERDDDRNQDDPSKT